MRLLSRSIVSILFSLFTLFVLLASLVAFQVGSLTAHATTAADTTLLHLTPLGTTHPTSGSTVGNGNEQVETAPGEEAENSPKRFISGPTPPISPPPEGTAPPDPSGKHVTTKNPGFKGFNGLSHADQRNAGTGAFTNTQFSLEPPDQGLCVSNKFVLDTVNTALAVRTPS